MTTAQRNIHQSLETRYSYSQAAREGAVRRGEIKLDVNARLLRLSSRYMTARREGRMQAAAAIKRMAERIANS